MTSKQPLCHSVLSIIFDKSILRHLSNLKVRPAEGPMIHQSHIQVNWAAQGNLTTCQKVPAVVMEIAAVRSEPAARNEPTGPVGLPM
jgi:hypothetical protein